MTTYVNPGLDASGNGNNWTTNNINWTSSGVTFDTMTDVPTNTSATTANFAVFNPLVNSPNPNGTLTNGNLLYTGNAASSSTYGTIAVTSGKFYFETTMQGIPASPTAFIGIAPYPYSSTYLRAYRYNDGQYFDGSSWASYGATFTTNDVIGCAFDMDSQTIEFFKNGTSQGQKTSIGLSGQTIQPFFFINVTPGAFSVNFGQQGFKYTPPTGFVALNTYNLPTPTIGATASSQANKYFDATLYTGNGSTQTITNSGSMQPDLVWMKARSTSGQHALVTSTIGVGTQLSTNNTVGDQTATDGITSLNSNGFSLGAGSIGYSTNNNGTTYVGWQWKANGGTGVTNTAGSITSTVSANTTSGFSVVTYTGNGSNPATVGHGLGVAPKWIIIKNRSTTQNWIGYHSVLGSDKFIEGLNTTNAAQTSTALWNNTAPTSSVFTIGNADVNTSGRNYVAYCWSEVAGFSKFGSYTGNGSSDGTFVYTGFMPRFIVWKNATTSATSWMMMDTARSTYNAVNAQLNPNTSDAESTASAINCDYLSNGFKLRGTSSNFNLNGDTIIYMAFAESPLKYANAR